MLFSRKTVYRERGVANVYLGRGGAVGSRVVSSNPYADPQLLERVLRRALGLTWGDLDSNVRRLAEKGYVKLWRGLGSGPRVLEVKIGLTELGEAEYEKLVARLRKLLESVEKKRE